jgi:hypothetical protein
MTAIGIPSISRTDFEKYLNFKVDCFQYIYAAEALVFAVITFSF